jgi:hypothetical protein
VLVVALACVTLGLSADLAYALYVYHETYYAALSFQAVMAGYDVSESEIMTIFNFTNDNSFFTVRVLAIQQEIYLKDEYLAPSNPGEEWASFYANPIEMFPSARVGNVAVHRLISGLSNSAPQGSLHVKVHVILEVLPLIPYATRTFDFYA